MNRQQAVSFLALLLRTRRHAEDEKALGIDYATLDQILIAHFEQGKPAEEIVAAGFDPEEVAYAIRRTNSYAFKRAVEPPFPEAKFYD